jgi:hypothetical protein
MHKLSGTKPGENNNSCGIFHHESNKIGFAFLWFSMILYAIYKKQPNGFTIWVTNLQGGPRKEVLLCNVVPGAPGRRGWSKFRRARRRLGRGRAGKAVWTTGARFAGLIGARSGQWGGHTVTGGGGRRGYPMRRAFGREGQRAAGVASGGLAEVEKGLLWLAVGPQPELAATALNGAGGGSVGRWVDLRAAGEAAIAL